MWGPCRDAVSHDPGGHEVLPDRYALHGAYGIQAMVRIQMLRIVVGENLVSSRAFTGRRFEMGTGRTGGHHGVPGMGGRGRLGGSPYRRADQEMA